MGTSFFISLPSAVLYPKMPSMPILSQLPFARNPRYPCR